jgi:hypothetical protein
MALSAASATRSCPAAVGWTSSQKRYVSCTAGSVEQSEPPVADPVKPPVQHGPVTLEKPNALGSCTALSDREPGSLDRRQVYQHLLIEIGREGSGRRGGGRRTKSRNLWSDAEVRHVEQHQVLRARGREVARLRRHHQSGGGAGGLLRREAALENSEQIVGAD